MDNYLNVFLKLTEDKNNKEKYIENMLSTVRYLRKIPRTKSLIILIGQNNMQGGNI